MSKLVLRFCNLSKAAWLIVGESWNLNPKLMSRLNTPDPITVVYVCNADDKVMYGQVGSFTMWSFMSSL